MQLNIVTREAQAESACAYRNRLLLQRCSTKQIYGVTVFLSGGQFVHNCQSTEDNLTTVPSHPIYKQNYKFMVYILQRCRFIDTAYCALSWKAIALFSGTRHKIGKWHSHKYSGTWWVKCDHETNCMAAYHLWLTPPTQTTSWFHEYSYMPHGSVSLNTSDGQIPNVISFKLQFQWLKQFDLTVKDSNWRNEIWLVI